MIILKEKELLVRGKAFIHLMLKCFPQTNSLCNIISGEFNKGGSLNV